ncbi:HNH endonuclease signature motif containing protein [Protofrankia coriariae]|uniref:HNH endonuclease signature motif containing protein n=1 Tax=Protofrankia coriariae TaxID=1562887 RepID=UPI00069B1264|nr:HNH endonuclease signature motif containing protein [Protofrankia coriariae]
MAELGALLSAVDAQAVYQRLDALARQATDSPDETRSMDARRADALVDLLLGRDRGAEVSVEVGVLVSAATLAGVSDVPGELAGYGAIPAATARELAAEATWRRILTDPAAGNRPVEVSRRFPAPGLARLLRTRERTCRFPGCRKPAQFCDLDHIHPHAAGGPTSEDNLLTLCRRHHRAKHDGGWTVHRTDGDTAIWTSPTGRTYPSIPEPWDEPIRPEVGEQPGAGEEEGLRHAPRRTAATVSAPGSDLCAGGWSRVGSHEPTTDETGRSGPSDLGPPPF